MQHITSTPLVVYGKGKAMQSLCDFIRYLDIEFVQMDDADADIESIQRAQVMIVTPGIKPSHRLYREYGDKIMSELSFLGLLIEKGIIDWRNYVDLIGITGTNGKSTTTRVLYQALELMRQQGIISVGHVHIGGNFDTPLSGLILRIMQDGLTQEHHSIVLECSSFMLWKLRYLTFRAGILLNIAHDHMDRHGTMDDYIQSKLNILLHSRSAITTAEIRDKIQQRELDGVSFDRKASSFSKTADQTASRSLYTPIKTFDHPGFIGKHNASNFGAVDLLLRMLYKDQYQTSLLDTVKPMPHRLQKIVVQNGLTIIDDSVCSSVHSLQAALEAMDNPVVLVAGGYDNGENYRGLLSHFRDHVGAAVFYGQTRAILYPLAKQVIDQVVMVETLSEALTQAILFCKTNTLTTILYSPGAKSFDQFDNVYQRIRVFEEEIEKLFSSS